MIGYVIIGMLAAFGAFSAGWVVFGLFRTWENGVLLLTDWTELGFVRRCIWLREMGLLHCRLAVWDADLSPGERIWLAHHKIEIWNPSCEGQGLGIGAKEHGAGTGDPPGRHQCGGVSEL